jgi:hypothetical protein
MLEPHRFHHRGCHGARRAGVVVIAAVFSAFADVQAGVASTTGAGQFTGTASLPQVPCDACGGSFVGDATLEAGGVGVSGFPFQAVWPDPTAPSGLSGVNGNMTANFAYSEPCLPPFGTTPPVEGSASGNFRLTGGLLSLGGLLDHGAVLTGDFSWLRYGATAVVTLSGTALYSSANQLVATTANPGLGVLDGVGAATFVPSALTPTCVSFAYNVTASVTGAFAQGV